jgi:CheY-like chemotaxis protein
VFAVMSADARFLSHSPVVQRMLRAQRAGGVEAMDFLRRQGDYPSAPRPDLILLDLNMPRKDGRQVLKEVKQDTELRSIPIVVLTTSDSEQDVVRTYDLQANCYVTKPVDFQQFTKIVKEIKQFWISVVKLPPS